jgi:hypothetical protein
MLKSAKNDMIKRSLYHQTREVYKKHLGLRDLKRKVALNCVNMKKVAVGWQLFG